MFKKIMCVLLVLPAIAFSSSEGSSLVHRFWKEVQRKEMHKLSSFITNDYQALTVNGVITKKQDLSNLKNISMTGFVLSHIRSTKHKHRLAVSYDLQVINGSTSSFFREIQVFEKRDGHWKVFATSFFPIVG